MSSSLNLILNHMYLMLNLWDMLLEGRVVESKSSGGKGVLEG